MNRIAGELLKIAAEINPQVTVVFDRKGAQERDLTQIQIEMQRFVSSIRRNENLESILSREDDNDTMRLSIGFTDHESKAAIVREVKHLADRLAHKSGIKAKIDVHEPS